MMQRALATRETVDDWGQADEQTLVRLAPSEPAAVGELYRRHAEPVFRYLLTCADNREDAADLAQQVFVRAMQALPVYRDQGVPFRAWLLRVARNAATDSFRRRRRTVPWETLPESRQPVVDEDPARLVVQQESLHRLAVLVAKLPPDRQDLLALRFAAGLTAAEIAVVVGGREAAIQKRLWRTLRKLRESYDDQV